MAPLYRAHAPLMLFAAAMAGLTAVALGGLVVDDRTLVGAPIWAKPLKFAVSFVVYAPTFAWLLSLLPRPSRVAWWAGTVTVVAGTIEMVIIVGQVVRGQRSHFNAATPLDSTLFFVMGVTVALLWLAGLALAVVLIRRGMSDPTLRTAIRAGVVIALVGMALGGLMLGATPEQQAAIAATGTSAVVGAHAVGVADGGPGLPLVNWSTTAGDLRIGHFLGMHALQALPLLALALSRAATRVRRLREPLARTRLVRVGAAGYAAVVALVTWQALRGQPLTSPDGVTLAALGLIVVGVATAGLLVLGRPTAVPAPAPS